MRLFFSTTYYYSTKVQSQNLLPVIPPTSRRRRRQPTWPKINNNNTHHHHHHHHQNRPKEKIIVIMGATGTGKSRLSIDLATRFFPSSEIINSDKMQLYRGLDITTNKIPFSDRRGVPHHLLGDVDPVHGDLSPAQYRSIARSTISDLLDRNKLPLVVGGSNSFIHALVDSADSTESSRFDEFSSVSTDLYYDCCFLWVDVSFPVLYQYLMKRVDDMLESGMFEELAEFFDSEEEAVLRPGVGIKKAIGVPEFERFFRCFPRTHYSSGEGGRTGGGGTMIDTQIKMDLARKVLYAEAVDSIKYNTCQLAKKQTRKIERLRWGGWDLSRLNATEAFRSVMASPSSGRSSEIWEKKVVLPSVKIVKRFLEG